MKTIFRGVATACAALLVAGAAGASTITFGALLGTNGDAFTGPYTEAGFTVLQTAGDVFEGHGFGNPEPSLVVGSVFGGRTQGTVEVTRSGGGMFNLTSFDWTDQNGPGGYFIVGYHGPLAIFSIASAADFGGIFQTVLGNTTQVDRLQFNLTANGTSLNLDNIVIGAGGVPEPASWALLLAGFGLTGAAVRRKRGARVTA